jgi:hypothetical protein
MGIAMRKQEETPTIFGLTLVAFYSTVKFTIAFLRGRG